MSRREIEARIEELVSKANEMDKWMTSTMFSLGFDAEIRQLREQLAKMDGEEEE